MRPNPDLLIVDPDPVFRERLARGMAGQGFEVRMAADLAGARSLAAERCPGFAVVELRLADGNGLRLVEELAHRGRACRVVVLTSHGSIATAVAAIRRGAVDYLTKPSDALTVARTLLSDDPALPEAADHPISADRARWEHIQREFEMNDRNVSETARRLGMHRRTLQRVLAKNAPR